MSARHVVPKLPSFSANPSTISDLVLSQGVMPGLWQFELLAGRRSFNDAMRLVNGASQVLDEQRKWCKEKHFQDRFLSKTGPWRMGQLVTVPAKGKLILCGDMHGDVDAFVAVLQDSKFLEDPDKRLLCVGDYINRGKSIHTFELVCSLLSHPLLMDRTVFLRGNHEDGSAKDKDRSIWTELEIHHPYFTGVRNPKRFVEPTLQVYDMVFQGLPLMVRTPNGLVVTHAGATNLLNPSATTAENLYSVAKAGNDISRHLMYNALHGGTGIQANPKAPGTIQFCEFMVSEFLRQVGGTYLIRGHQPAPPPGLRYNGSERIGWYTSADMLTLNTGRFGGRKASYAVVDLERSTIDDSAVTIKTLDLPDLTYRLSS